MTQSQFDLNHYQFQSEIISSKDLTKLENSFKKMARFYSYLFKPFLGANKAIEIIDLPCGHGNILYFLQSNGYTNCVGYDIDEGRISIAKRLSLNAQLADGIEIIKNKKNINVIFCLDFMEHLQKEKAFEFASLCREALSQDGIFIMRMPITDSIKGPHDLYNDITHQWSANSQAIRNVLLQHGYSKVIIIDERPVPYKLLNIARLFLFTILKNCVNLFYTMLGFQKFTIWSTSCFFICYKSSSKD